MSLGIKPKATQIIPPRAEEARSPTRFKQVYYLCSAPPSILTSYTCLFHPVIKHKKYSPCHPPQSPVIIHELRNEGEGEQT